jgi:hypothetical protein
MNVMLQHMGQALSAAIEASQGMGVIENASY